MNSGNESRQQERMPCDDGNDDEVADDGLLEIALALAVIVPLRIITHISTAIRKAILR